MCQFEAMMSLSTADNWSLVATSSLLRVVFDEGEVSVAFIPAVN